MSESVRPPFAGPKDVVPGGGRVRPVLPNFLIIGAMKAGTTSLYRYLRSHPQVFMPGRKEPQFFSRRNWEQQLESYYEPLFEGAGDAVTVGEASTSYTKYPLFPDVPARIAKTVPDVRLIYVIRHPIERARSHYMHEVIRDKERAPIETALLENDVYLDISRYAMQIDQYLAHFPRDQLLVIRSEDLRDSKGAVMRQVYRFIGVDDSWVPKRLLEDFHRTEERREVRPWYRRMYRLRAYRGFRRRVPSALRRGIWRLFEGVFTWQIDPQRGYVSDDLRRELERRVRDDVRRLRTYLGDDFDGWGIA